MENLKLNENMVYRLTSAEDSLVPVIESKFKNKIVCVPN